MYNYLLTIGVLNLALLGLTAPTLAQNTHQPLNLLTLVQGNVQIRRASWLGPLAQFRPVAVGTVVDSGDRLKLAPEANAIVLCSNLSQWQVPAGQEIPVAQGCGDREQRLYRPGSQQVSPRAGEHEANLPYFLSPH